MFKFTPVPRHYCAMCDVQCSSESAFRLHHKCATHQTNLILYEVKTAISPSPFTMYSRVDASMDSKKIFTYIFPSH